MYWIDKLEFGSPTIDQLSEMSHQTYLDGIFSKLTEYGFPKNSSESTREELNRLASMVQTIKEDSDWKRRYYMFDRMMYRFFKETLTEDTEASKKIQEITSSIIEDSTPLMLKLKYYYNRPRPRQLAAAYKLKLFPHKSVSDDTPSFPSGKVFQSKLICEVIGNVYPESYGDMMKIHTDICNARLYMGLNFQSDVDTAIFFAEEVMKMKEFKVKYKL